VKTAKLFRKGRGQGVWLPHEFRFDGDHVFLKRVGNGVLILPSKKRWNTLVHSLGQFSEDFMAERDQPEQQDHSEVAPI
jgi:antitoxin VapB